MMSKLEIAEKRIKILFKLAEQELKKGNSDRTKRYILLARKIGAKCQYTFPKELKMKFCRKCNMLLISEISCSTNLNKEMKTMDIKCFNCNNIRRYSYDKPDRKGLSDNCGKTEE
ncbi:MAG: ribonuclease P protein component 4 [Candidatus Aenigmarchaeota archaeon]|nr:ribonuclease P protein component 4 [Candidatus Aenigmarchaeota archaeon]